MCWSVCMPLCICDMLHNAICIAYYNNFLFTFFVGLNILIYLILIVYILRKLIMKFCIFIIIEFTIRHIYYL